MHHLADSHVNSYARYRLALTEAAPSIKTYNEKAWAELPDARTGPIDMSIVLLEGLHARWSSLLRSMAPADFERTFVHPERGAMTLALTTRLYRGTAAIISRTSRSARPEARDRHDGIALMSWRAPALVPQAHKP